MLYQLSYAPVSVMRLRELVEGRQESSGKRGAAETGFFLGAEVERVKCTVGHEPEATIARAKQNTGM